MILNILLKIILFYNLNYSHHIMLRQCAYDMICFEEQCVKRKQQLYLYDQLSESSNIHYQPHHHHSISIDSNTPLFRRLSSIEFQLKLNKESYISQITNQYKIMKENIIKKLDQRYQSYLQSIKEIYLFADRYKRFQCCRNNLQYQTKFTELFINVINFYFVNQHQSLAQYLNAKLQKLWENEKDIIQNCQNLLQKAHYQHNLLIKKAYNPTNKFQGNFDKKTKEQLKQQNQKLLTQICRQFLESKSNLRYKSLSQDVQRDIKGVYTQTGHTRLDKKLTTINIGAFNFIEKVVFDHFSCSKNNRLSRAHKIMIRGQLRKYNEWMATQQMLIYQKFLKLHNNVDPDVDIGKYEAYVIYTKLVIKVIQKLHIKGKQLDYNIIPLDLSKQIVYLYFHFSSLQQTIKILNDRYPNNKSITSEVIKQKFIAIILQIYQQILQKYNIEQDLLFYTYILDGNYQIIQNKWCWSRILQIFVYFRIKKDINRNDIDSLLSLIQKLIKNYMAINEKNKLTNQKGLFNTSFCKIEEKNPVNLFTVKPMNDDYQNEKQKKRRQLIQDSKIVKLEHRQQGQYQLSMEYEIDSYQSQKQIM